LRTQSRHGSGPGGEGRCRAVCGQMEIQQHALGGQGRGKTPPGEAVRFMTAVQTRRFDSESCIGSSLAIG
jgi:hypothetical protein